MLRIMNTNFVDATGMDEDGIKSGELLVNTDNILWVNTDLHVIHFVTGEDLHYQDNDEKYEGTAHDIGQRCWATNDTISNCLLVEMLE